MLSPTPPPAATTAAMALTVRSVKASTAVTPDDHGAIAQVAAVFCTSIALFFLCTRLLVRWPWSRLLGKDDVAVFIASIACVVQMVLVLLATSAGFGKQNHLLSLSQQVHAAKLLYVSQLLYVLTLYLSRFAIVFFFLRLENTSKLSGFVRSLFYLCILLSLASLVVVATQQTSTSHWAIPTNANAKAIFTRWTVVEVVGDFYEVALIFYPIWLVYRLQMRFSMKVKVIVGVAFRAPIIVVSALRLHYMWHGLHSSNVFFALIDTAILTQVELSYALISATVPTLQIFLRAAKSSLIGETVHAVAGSAAFSYTRSSRKSRSRNLGSKTSKRRNIAPPALELTDINSGKTTTVITKGSGPASLASDSSERAIVMHQTVDIQTDLESTTIPPPAIRPDLTSQSV